MSLLVAPGRRPVGDGDSAAHLHHLAEVLRETTRMQERMQELMQQQFDFLHSVGRSDKAVGSPHTPSHRGPLNPAHQTWRGFVEDLQKLQAYAAREGLKLSKANVCQFGVDTARTITRTMQWYGLRTTDWPPSTWDPNEDRPGGAGTQTRR